ncbi:MAG: glycerophosphoryl diester phosphodiesterase membrane domain-containing protein [Henriciella sp.]|uniref:glycerophosphoryl diester phosphodiesterase membrane domain-containing protein n=1 Tax=Henriciella sp. TaxID=1968823 RepID=UPI003C735ED8
MAERGPGMDEKALDIGYVIETTIKVIRERLTELLLLAVIFIAVPQIVLSFLLSAMFDTAVQTGSIMPNFSFSLLIGTIVAALLPILMQAAAVFTTVEALTGRPSDVGRSVGVALAVFLPLLGLSILMGIGLSIGFMLLFIPGLILLTYWAVTVPSFVIEDTGIIGAFERSAELTKGQRWRIFGLMVLVWVVYMIIGALFSVLSLGNVTAPTSTQPFSLIGVIFNTLIAMISAIVSSVGVAVLYVHLRDLKEGTSPERISDVFG